MILLQKKYVIKLVALGLLFFSSSLFALRFEPGVGVGLQYTDNAALTKNNKVDEAITVGYVGARIAEDEGALTYDATTSFNNQHYTKNTFSDQNNFDLGAGANWEMIKDRFNWFLNDKFTQRSISSLGSNTPSNLEDSNVFTFGADVQFPISARQNFSVTPQFSQYYYERQTANNKQYSLSTNWNYQMFRLNNVGLNFSVRKIDYTENDRSGRPIDDTTFTDAAIVFSGKKLRSIYTVNLGATRARTNNGSNTDGFAGYLDWLIELSSRSDFQTLLSTELTDTSSAGFNGVVGLDVVNDNDVQITTDVIRTNIVNLTYSRKDDSLDSQISARYNKINYSNSPLDLEIRNLDVNFGHPVTQLLTSGIRLNYNRNERVDTGRVDKNYIAGVNLSYLMTRKLNASFDLSYRTRDSTVASQNYDEFSIFVSMTYGFGQVQQPSQTGGF